LQELQGELVFFSSTPTSLPQSRSSRGASPAEPFLEAVW
jgi:hypothetical protein